jgi:hypothetical protein
MASPSALPARKTNWIRRLAGRKKFLDLIGMAFAIGINESKARVCKRNHVSK